MKQEHGIVGGGFTGLSFAYYLVEAGVDPRSILVWDSGDSLIGTRHLNWGLAETAANGVFASREFPEICRQIGVELLAPQPTSRRRYIYRDGKMHRWPMGFAETFSMATRFLRCGFQWRPRPYETLAHWGRRLGGQNFVDYLLQPGIQGVFGSSAEQLSARLVLQALRPKPNRQPAKRQTLAPVNGMGDYLRALAGFLKARGVRFESGVITRRDLAAFSGQVTLATDPIRASELLDPADLRRSWLLQHERVGLASHTLCVQEDGRVPRGFGALFPMNHQSPRAPLGVLFNSDIFSNRVFQSELRSETWIYPCNESHVPSLDQVLTDRRKFLSLSGPSPKVVGHEFVTWPRALPLYSVEWEKCLEKISLHPAEGPLLLGPSYGGLGLASVLGDCRERAQALALGRH